MKAKNTVSITILWTLFFLFIIGAGLNAQTSSTLPRLKVLSYNIHHANPPEKPDFIDIKAIARVIVESGADIVALQELDIKNRRSGIALDQAAELGNLTGMHHFFAKGIDFQDGQYGVAILSKYPILQSERFALPMTDDPGGEPRALALVQFQHTTGKRFYFACTHLDLKEENQQLQADYIVKKLNALKKYPVILAGDLNAVAGSYVVNLLQKHFRDDLVAGPTYPQVNPERKIDYILSRPKDKLKVLDSKIILEEYASDHLPVYVEYSW